MTVEPATVQLMPHAFAIAVVPGAANESVHPDTAPDAVTVTSATYPSPQLLCGIQDAETPPGFGVADAVGRGLDVGVGLAEGLDVGRGLDVGFGLAKGLDVGFGLADGLDVGFGAGVGLDVAFGLAVGIDVGDGVAVGVRIGRNAVSLAVCQVRQSSFTSPPVSPLLGLNDQ